MSDHLFITGTKALRLALLVCGLPHEGLHLIQGEEAVHIIVVAQEIGRERLCLIETAVLGGNGLKLFNEGVRRRVAGYVDGAIIKYVDASASGKIPSP